MQMNEPAAQVRIAEIVVEEGGIAVDRVAEAERRPQRVADMVRGLAETGARLAPEGVRGLEIERAGRDLRRHQALHLVVKDVRRARLLRIAQVLIVAVGGAAVQIEHAEHPVERTAGLGAQVELLGNRIDVVQPVLHVLAAVEGGRERNVEPALRIRSGLIGVFHAAQRLEHHVVEVIGRDQACERLVVEEQARPIAGLLVGIWVGIVDVLALDLVLVGLRVIDGPGHREGIVRLEQRRDAHVVVVVVVELEVGAGHLGGGRIPLLVDEVPGHPQRERARERQIDGRRHMLQVEGADLEIGVARIAAVELRLDGDHVDRAAHRILPEHRALWTAQHLDVVHVQEVGGERNGIRDEDAVLVERHRGRRAVVLGGIEADAADRHDMVVAVGLSDDEARHFAIQVLGRPDEVVFERVRRQRSDGFRGLLQILVLLLAHHHDALELVGRLSRHCPDDREKDKCARNPRYPLRHGPVH